MEGTLLPESRVLASQSHRHPPLDLRLPAFPLTAGGYLSAGFPSVSADIVLPLFAILIYQLSFIRPPSRHYSQSTHTAMTPWSRSWGGGGGGGGGGGEGWDGKGGACAQTRNDERCFFHKMHIG